MALSDFDVAAIQNYALVLEESKSTSDRILDSLPFIFMILNHQGRIIKINEKAAIHYKTPAERALGAYFLTFLGDEGQGVFKRFFHEAEQKTNHADGFELEEAGETAQFLYWQVCSYKHSLAGQLIHVLIGIDVSEIRQSHQEIADLKRDFQTAESLQKHLMPDNSDPVTKTFRVVSCYEAAERVGGDWWWYNERLNGDVALMIGDVTGHGVDAAIVTATTVGALHAIIQQMAPEAAIDLTQVLTQLNRYFMQLNKRLHHMTITGCHVSGTKDHAALYFCGSPPALLLKKGETKVLTQAGSPLGFIDQLSIGTIETPFHKGERIFIASDGSFGFKTDTDRLFSQKKLMELVESCQELDLAASRDKIRNEIRLVRGKSHPDDLTFILVERL